MQQSMLPHVVVFDGLNFLHKAASWTADRPGPQTVGALIKSLRASIEELKASRAVFVLEGKPKARLELFPEYKANRRLEAGSAAEDRKREFMRWCNLAVEVVARWLPVAVVRHPDYEADDVVHTLLVRSSRVVPFTIVSSDTDFIQELAIPNVTVWNPTKNRAMTHPGHDYVTWKALRGDPGDGIPGIPGIGDATATKLMSDPDALGRLLSRPEAAERFTTNHSLITLAEVPEVEFAGLESSTPTRDWSTLRAELLGMGLRKLTDDPYWSKTLVATFDPLWGRGEGATS